MRQLFCYLLICALTQATLPGLAAAEFSVATFNADITIPIGHACMGGGVADAKEVLDPLYARGFVLHGADRPIVVVALDWCQCNNDSYDVWRDGLAAAAATTRERVMLATVHQHDAPICDLTAQKLLDQVGLFGYNCDAKFHAQAIQRTAVALKASLREPRRVTHFGVGQAKVERIASNRRVVTPSGKATWERGSSSGDIYGAPEGQIDPWLKTLSFWDGDSALVAWSCYAVHPMSTYGRGQVSADFPGLARQRRQADDPDVFQIYFTGCAGDTTAGKYNTKSSDARKELAERLYQAQVAAWKATVRHPLDRVQFRTAALDLPPRDTGEFTVDSMQRQLADSKLSRWQRISAALGLSWRQRVAQGQPIDVPCLELGDAVAAFLVLPAESFVGYQLAAQRIKPNMFVMVSGFGDGAPGYIPTDECWTDGYDDNYCWVAPNVEEQIISVVRKLLSPTKERPE